MDRAPGPTPLVLPAGLRRLAAAGAAPGDDDELRIRKQALVLSTALMAGLSCIWVVTYALLGLWGSAAIPFGYQLASLAALAVFARTRRYVVFRESQLAMSLVLPVALQWSLGGFEASSAVSLWAFTSPLGALVFAGARRAMPWFAAFAALIGLSAVLDSTLAQHAADIPQGVVIAFFALTLVGVSLTAFVLLQFFVRGLARERARSERLLLNVLPAPIAARLRERDDVIADDHPAVTVLFADLAGFTPLAQRMAPAELVAMLDRIFSDWDALAAERGVEKIKTIGDAYMAVAGIPLARPDHVAAVAELALAMGAPVERAAAAAGVPLGLRIGIDSGAVVAGVIGRSRFTYDLWGETVNTASRMQTHAEPGTIQVTGRVCEALADRFAFGPPRVVDVKGKGPMTCHALLARA